MDEITNHSTLNYKELPGDNALDKFQLYMQKNNSIDDLIAFLQMLDDRYAGMLNRVNNDPSQLTEDERRDIINFAEFFVEEYDEVTLEARYLMWGDADTLTLRLATALYDIEIQQAFDELYEELTDNQKHELDTLADMLLAIRNDRIITFDWEEERERIELPAYVPREDFEYTKQMMRQYALYVILNEGTVIVREYADVTHTTGSIYGFKINPFCVWEPIEAYNLRKMLLTTPSGKVLQPKHGVTYVSKPRTVPKPVIKEEDQNIHDNEFNEDKYEEDEEDFSDGEM